MMTPQSTVRCLVCVVSVIVGFSAPAFAQGRKDLVPAARILERGILPPTATVVVVPDAAATTEAEKTAAAAKAAAAAAAAVVNDAVEEKLCRAVIRTPASPQNAKLIFVDPQVEVLTPATLLRCVRRLNLAVLKGLSQSAPAEAYADYVSLSKWRVTDETFLGKDIEAALLSVENSLAPALRCDAILRTEPSADNAKAILVLGKAEAADASTLAGCVRALTMSLRANAAILRENVGNTDQQLADVYAGYLKFREWVRFVTKDETDAQKKVETDAKKNELELTFRDLKAVLDPLLSLHGLKQGLFTAEVRAGQNFASIGRLPGEDKLEGSSQPDRPKSQRPAFIEFTSRPFGREAGRGSRWSASIIGQFGYLPAINVAKVETTTITPTGTLKPSTEVTDAGTTTVIPTAAATEATTFTATVDTALMFNSGARAAFRLGDAELTAAWQLGTFLDVATATSVSLGGQEVTAIQLAGVKGGGSGFQKLEASFRLFDSPIPLVRLSNAALSPSFEVWGSYVWDYRFDNVTMTGIPAANTFTADRYRFGAQLALNKITGLNVGDPNRTIAFVIVVEREGSRGMSTLPAFTKFSIRANVDIFKSLLGQDSAGK